MSASRTLFALATLALIAPAACKDETGKVKPTVVVPAATTAPATKYVAAPDPTTQIADLDNFPDENPVTYTDDNGEIWERYSSGLMVQDIRQGTVGSPKIGQTVKVAISMKLADGPDAGHEVFKSTKEDPKVFRLGSKSEIKGLNQALLDARRKGLRRALIPAELAWGEKGNPELKVGPNQALLCDIELISMSGDPAKMPEMKKPKDLFKIDFGPPAPATAPHPK